MWKFVTDHRSDSSMRLSHLFRLILPLFCPSNFWSPQRTFPHTVTTAHAATEHPKQAQCARTTTNITSTPLQDCRSEVLLEVSVHVAYAVPLVHGLWSIVEICRCVSSDGFKGKSAEWKVHASFTHLAKCQNAPWFRREDEL